MYGSGESTLVFQPSLLVHHDGQDTCPRTSSALKLLGSCVWSKPHTWPRLESPHSTENSASTPLACILIPLQLESKPSRQSILQRPSVVVGQCTIAPLAPASTMKFREAASFAFIVSLPHGFPRMALPPLCFLSSVLLAHRTTHLDPGAHVYVKPAHEYFGEYLLESPRHFNLHSLPRDALHVWAEFLQLLVVHNFSDNCRLVNRRRRERERDCLRRV